MEFRQLRYFVAVAEEGNVGRAARRLNVSQPPVSRQIHTLEYEIGAELLVRTPKGVELTEAGKVFYKHAQKVLSLSSSALDHTRAAHRGELGRLDVAYFGSTIYRTVPILLRAFHQRNPQIEISLTRMGKGEQINAIREGRIHIGFGRYYNQAEGITIEPISKEPLFAAVPVSSKLAEKDSVRFADFSALPLVLFPAGDRPSFADEIIGLFRGADVDYKVADVASDATSALALVATGTRCTIVPEAVTALAFPGLRYLPIENCSRLAPVSCILPAADRPPVLRAFLKDAGLQEGECDMSETQTGADSNI